MVGGPIWTSHGIGIVRIPPEMPALNLRLGHAPWPRLVKQVNFLRQCYIPSFPYDPGCNEETFGLECGSVAGVEGGTIWTGRRLVVYICEWEMDAGGEVFGGKYHYSRRKGTV